VAELGFEGVFFRSILDLDPGLDAHHLRDLRWQASHPDLSVEETKTLVRHAHETEARMRRGDILDPDHYFPPSGLSVDEQVDFIMRCHAHLRRVLELVVGQKRPAWGELRAQGRRRAARMPSTQLGVPRQSTAIQVGQRNPAREEHTRQRKSVVDGDLIIEVACVSHFALL